MTVKILSNPVVAKLYEPTAELRSLLSQLLSYQVKDLNWTGYASFYNMKTDTFPAGFVRLVKRKLELAGHKVIHQSKQPPDPAGPVVPVVDDFEENPLYDYQYQTASSLCILKRMIAQVATGGGKSRIFKIAAERLALPTLFMTTRKSLMYQMAESYEATLKKPVGILGDGVWNPNPNGVNFAIIDTLASRLESSTPASIVDKELTKHHERIEALIEKILKAKGLPTSPTVVSALPAKIQKQIKEIRDRVNAENPFDRKVISQKVSNLAKSGASRRDETLRFLEGIGFLCLEEAHEVSSNSFYNISNLCKNAHYRLALTATPFMKDDEEANMRLMAVTGPIGIRVTEHLLIQRGILAKPYFKYIKTSNAPNLRRKSSWMSAYKHGIVEHDWRNQCIVAEAQRAKRYGLSVMVLVNRSEHGRILLDMLKTAGLTAQFIYGAHEQQERKIALQHLERGHLDVLIGSTILDVGVDVPSVGLVIIASAGKAEVNLRQRIGRGLRAKKSGPNVAFILDFEDRHNVHLIKHSRERRRIVESTPGFAENIVADFDYEGCGFHVAKT